jgi:DMSO/TMAO reductase YedYZ molybdopterin-dependent catalytic subunit
VAAAVALGVGELVSGLGEPGQSLVLSVGNEVIDVAPGDFARFGIDTFGTADKPALVIGTVLIALAVGAALGAESVRRRWVGGVACVVFGLLGAVAGVRDPLASGAVAVVAGLAAAVAGTASLYLLLALAEGRVRTDRAPAAATDDSGGPRRTPGDGLADRRAFFGWAGGLTAFAALAAAGGRRLASRSPAEEARERLATEAFDPIEIPEGFESELPELSPRITPNDDFYIIDEALVVPQIDPAGWELSISGMVDDPFHIDYDELLELSTTEAEVTLSCVSNFVGGDLVGNAIWRGTPLRDLLERAGVHDDASQIVGRSIDNFTVGIPTELIMDGRDALVAVAMNGEPLPVRHGFPARLVVSGLYGYVSATKWLTSIELTTWDAFDGYWVPRGWSKEGPVKTQSRIDTPRGFGSIPAGPRAIAGVAWAPSRGISKVEVQVDDGEWQEAELGPSTSDSSWVQWRLNWDATSGEHELRVRATDGEGETQTEEEEEPFPDGATGYHEISVEVD